MRKFAALLAAASTTLGNRLIGISREMEESQRRFEVLGLDAETTQRIMSVYNQHRSYFDLDKRLSQALAAGQASADEVAAMIGAVPGAFKDAQNTYVEAKVRGAIPWPELIEHLDLGS